MANIIKIEQSLYGYSNGHQLIESSSKFPKETERVIHLLSDMSGSSMITGFENYITGYPIDNVYYALARTWYASEMKRPGCVWTHTLILRKNDLSSIDNLSTLLEIFVRPDKARLENYYSNTIELNIEDSKPRKNNNDYAYNNILNIIYALYNNNDPVFIFSDESKTFESLIIEIWSQQWAELRYSFCFCSGSISNRKVNNKIFDLQVIPYKNKNQINREVINGIFIDDLNKSNENEILWAKLATIDILGEKNIREILWEIARGEKNGRKLFKFYLEIIDYLNKFKSNNNLSKNITNKICDLFPSSNDAISLKKTIYFNSGIIDNSLNIHLDKYSLLKELFTTNCYLSFDSNLLGIAENGKIDWKTNKFETINLLSNIISSEHLNLLGEDYISGIADDLSPSDLIDLSQDNLSLLYVFLFQNPLLANSEELWNRLNNQTKEILDIVSKSNKLNEEKIKLIVKSIINAQINEISENLVSVFNGIPIFEFLNWLNSANYCIDDIIEPKEPILIEWDTTLTRNVDFVFDWIVNQKEPSNIALAYSSKIFDPYSKRIISLGSDIWLPLAEKISSSNNKKKYLSIKGFILTLGFNKPSGFPDKIVRFCFEDIHDAIAENKLDYKTWNLLERSLPRLFWWMNWDRCDRLRRAFVDRFVKFNWSEEEFIKSVKNKDTFYWIVEYCKNSENGKKFINKVKNKAIKGLIPASNIHLNILTNNE